MEVYTMDVVFTVAAITYQVELYEYHGMCVFPWGTTQLSCNYVYNVEHGGIYHGCCLYSGSITYMTRCGS